VLSGLFNQHEFNGIADCLDNFESRFALEELLNNHSFLVHGGVQTDYGQITTIKKNETIQLKHLYKNTQKTEPVLPVCPQIVSCAGSMMAYEILNNLWNTPQLLNTLLVIELSDFSFFKIKLDQGA
jgi:molybdopterin/thiamine biosynthesis adenylyltransferase